MIFKYGSKMSKHPIKINRILFIRMSAIGDIILTTPLIRAAKARFPEAEVDFLTKQEHQELLAHHPLLHRVIGFDAGQGLAGLLGLAWELRKEHYDLVVDLHSNPRSILVRSFCGAKTKRRSRKYSLERRLLSWFGVNLLKNAVPVAERYFTALADFGISPNGDGPEIYLSKEDSQKAEKILAEAGLWGRRVIGLAPGASRFTKIWPAKNFAEAGYKLAKDLNAGVIILGGEEDREVSAQVFSGLKAAGVEKALNLAGKLSILESAAVIRSLELLVSNDSALMHLATAVQTPVVAIFGPTTKELGFFPYSQKAAVAQKEGLNCRPCSLHGDSACREKHFRCMTEISPETVVDAAEGLLKE